MSSFVCTIGKQNSDFRFHLMAGNNHHAQVSQAELLISDRLVVHLLSGGVERSLMNEAGNPVIMKAI